MGQKVDKSTFRDLKNLPKCRLSFLRKSTSRPYDPTTLRPHDFTVSRRLCDPTTLRYHADFAAHRLCGITPTLRHTDFAVSRRHCGNVDSKRLSYSTVLQYETQRTTLRPATQRLLFIQCTCTMRVQRYWTLPLYFRGAESYTSTVGERVGSSSNQTTVSMPTFGDGYL